jgi:hypothetical protein
VSPAITAVGVNPVSIVGSTVGELGEQDVRITIKKRIIIALNGE